MYFLIIILGQLYRISLSYQMKGMYYGTHYLKETCVQISPPIHGDNKSQNFRLGGHHHVGLNSQCPYD